MIPQEVINNIEPYKGMYIRFSGTGILNRLAIPRTKYHFYRIIGLHGKDNLLLKGFRARKNSILVRVNAYRQKCEVITKKEWKQLPQY